MSEKKYLSDSGLQRVWTKIKSLLNGKVDKVSGKGLSTNDYTTAEKNKLAGIASGAEVNVQSDWAQTTTTAKDYIKNKPDISTLLNGKVDKVSGKGLSTNDYTAAEKTKLSGIETGANKTTVDSALSSTSINPVQNKVINAALGDKVDKVSGKRLSTNDYTTAEKNKLASIEQGAKVNVQPDWSQTDMSSDDFIKNKPTIPAAQIQSDWNQNDSTAKDYIKNKPSVPSGQVQSDWNQTDTTAPDYIKNKPSAPSGQVQADWNQTTTTEPDYIKNKPNITTLLNGKVDKVSGKGLSTNDYTDIDKATLDWLSNSEVAFVYVAPSTVTCTHTYAQLNALNMIKAHLSMRTSASSTKYLYYDCVYWTKISGSNPGIIFYFIPVEDMATATNPVLGIFNNPIGILVSSSGVSVVQSDIRLDPQVQASLCTPMMPWSSAQQAAAKQTLGISAGSQVQADWNQALSTEPDYIKNKPTLFSNNYTELWSGNADDLSGGTPYNLSDDYINFTHLLIVCMDDEDRVLYSQVIPVDFVEGNQVSFNHVRSNYIAWCAVTFPRYDRFYVAGESYGHIVLSPRAVYGFNLQSHSN